MLTRRWVFRAPCRLIPTARVPGQRHPRDAWVGYRQQILAEAAALRARSASHNAMCSAVPADYAGLVAHCRQSRAELLAASAAYQEHLATYRQDIAQPFAAPAASASKTITRNGKIYQAAGPLVPLGLALRRRDARMVALLLDYGGDPNPWLPSQREAIARDFPDTDAQLPAAVSAGLDPTRRLSPAPRRVGLRGGNTRATDLRYHAGAQPRPCTRAIGGGAAACRDRRCAGREARAPEHARHGRSRIRGCTEACAMDG